MRRIVLFAATLLAPIVCLANQSNLANKGDALSVSKCIMPVGGVIERGNLHRILHSISMKSYDEVEIDFVKNTFPELKSFSQMKFGAELIMYKLRGEISCYEVIEFFDSRDGFLNKTDRFFPNYSNKPVKMLRIYLFENSEYERRDCLNRSWFLQNPEAQSSEKWEQESLIHFPNGIYIIKKPKNDKKRQVRYAFEKSCASLIEFTWVK
ncbi:hypothetical protein V8J88_15585 [Massilia sp. W12]|uniref:hypothetical protein n=1 Tax=Massilia sp. W12 TaxID=3126507 RepID=UPI0030CD0418